MQTRKFKQLVQHQDSLADLGAQDLQLKHWAMEKGYNIFYQNHDYHTLSFYLSGGRNNQRVGTCNSNGQEGVFCFMPQHQDSTWHIRENVEFAHLYLNNNLLRRFAAHTYEMDTRQIELQEQVFRQDDELKPLFLACFRAGRIMAESGCNMALENTSQNVLHHILKRFNVFDVKHSNLKSGLSAHHRRKIIAYIKNKLEEKITIAELAELVHLSPYHFAKMFKLSFGEAPAVFVNWMRVEKVKQLLRSRASLSEISLQSGFSQQSHMTYVFKRSTGITPACYRKKL